MLYTSIIDTPMIAWHYFYKYYVLHSTLKDEQTILSKIELFKDNAMQLALWQMNLKMCQTMQANKESYLYACFGCLIEGNNYSEIACETRSKKSKEKNKSEIIEICYTIVLAEIKSKGFTTTKNIENNLKKYVSNLAPITDILEIIIDKTYTNILSELKYKGFKDNSENVEIGIQLKNYIASLANDKDIMPSVNYFKSLQQTENFNFTDPNAWVNDIDTIFYTNCQVLQEGFPIDIKQLSILEFYTRRKYLTKQNKKTIK